MSILIGKIIEWKRSVFSKSEGGEKLIPTRVRRKKGTKSDHLECGDGKKSKTEQLAIATRPSGF